jgi:anti-sigma-K factor RskA
MSEGKAMSEAHDCGDDAAAYVLGALEPAEAAAFGSHLKECAVCREEVEALEGVVHALPIGVPQVAAPRSLRRKVMRTVRRDAGRESAAKGPVVRPRSRKSAAREPAAWRTPRAAIGALAAAAVVAVAAVAGVELGGSGHPGRVIRAQVVGIPGSAQLRVHGGHGELIVRRLAAPPRGQVYEVWLRVGSGSPVPASVLFTVGAGGGADVGLPGSLIGVSQVMVTSEPDGGTTKPTHSPVIVASL